MKRLLFAAAFFALPLFAGAQDFVDEVFSKYSGNQNFTSIVISKNLLDFAFTVDKENDLNRLKGKISDLKILVSEHKADVNLKFTDEIRSNLNKNEYMSLIEIKDGKTKVNFYVKKNGDKIVHLLLLASETDQDVLLSLTGEFTMKDLSEIGKSVKGDGSFHHLSYLKNVKEQQ